MKQGKARQGKAQSNKVNIQLEISTMQSQLHFQTNGPGDSLSALRVGYPTFSNL
jgi:hypothetical protein